ncbi:MAG: ABC transporter ATP-binding protein [Nanoarchaeota archaeon]
MNSIIELQNISLYREKTQILKDISWNIKKGAHWALIGPNGAGKTSLLKIISGSLWPSSGKVKVLGKEFGKTDLRELKKKIGWVSSFLTEKIPQNEDILGIVISGKFASFGVYEKITEKDRKKAKGLLKMMDCDYIIGRNFNVISQGEKQKVLIARALMAEPLILLLDEPCIGLDIKARGSLLASISKLCRETKTTIIYVTHHIEEIVKEIMNVLLLKDGKSFLQGKKKKILNKENLDKMFR